jgi:hypothetical protein
VTQVKPANTNTNTNTKYTQQAASAVGASRSSCRTHLQEGRYRINHIIVRVDGRVSVHGDIRGRARRKGVPEAARARASRQRPCDHSRAMLNVHIHARARTPPRTLSRSPCSRGSRTKSAAPRLWRRRAPGRAPRARRGRRAARRKSLASSPRVSRDSSHVTAEIQAARRATQGRAASGALLLGGFLTWEMTLHESPAYSALPVAAQERDEPCSYGASDSASTLSGRVMSRAQGTGRFHAIAVIICSSATPRNALKLLSICYIMTALLYGRQGGPVACSV